MLMISRRVGERIVIGGDIEVTITEIHRRTVRIAIKTGKAQKVLRGEVFDSIERANRLAAESVIDEESLAGIPAAAPAPVDAQGAPAIEEPPLAKPTGARATEEREPMPLVAAAAKREESAR